MSKTVEAELKRLEDLDVIEKVEGPPSWIFSIVVAPKPKNPNKIRICADIRVPNQMVKQEKGVPYHSRCGTIFKDASLLLKGPEQWRS
jgi:hypothetical protein